MPKPHTQVEVTEIPDCDMSNQHGEAYADARLPAYGSWANVCKPCFRRQGCGLGLGLGQRLIKREAN